MQRSETRDNSQECIRLHLRELENNLLFPFAQTRDFMVIERL